MGEKTSEKKSKLSNPFRASTWRDVSPFKNNRPSARNALPGDNLPPPPAYSASPPVGMFGAPTMFANMPATPAMSAIPINGPAESPAHTAEFNDGDEYAFLKKFDTVFLIDDSSSMTDEGRPGSRVSRWEEVRSLLGAIAPVCTKYDKDGIDIYFLNHENPRTAETDLGGYYNVRNANEVSRIFKNTAPQGWTPTGERLEAILGEYMKKVRAAACSSEGFGAVKPLNVIVITDGVPSDDPTGVLTTTARGLTDLHAPASQLGVQFFQVGTDASASKALAKLDDDLAETTGRDIVDAVTWDKSGGGLTEDGILKVVLGAVNKRLDREPMAGNQARS